MAGSKNPKEDDKAERDVPSSGEFASFYKTDNGRLLGGEIEQCLEEALSGKKFARRYLLCIGYPVPDCLPLFRKAKSFSVFTPFAHGPQKLVEKGLNRSLSGDEARLPFMDSSFDVAVVLHAVEYMEDPVSFFEALWKSLSPGGRLILMIPNRAGGWKKSGIPRARDEQGFDFKAACDFLFQKGFECVRCWGVFHGFKFAKGKRPILEGVMRSVSKKGPGLMPGFLILEAEKIIGSKGRSAEEPARLAPTKPVPT